MSERENPIPSIETVQAELRATIEELRRVRQSLRALQESLAAEREETGDDVARELRSVIDCVLLDSLGPAIRDLLAVTDDPGKGRGPGG